MTDTTQTDLSNEALYDDYLGDHKDASEDRKAVRLTPGKYFLEFPSKGIPTELYKDKQGRVGVTATLGAARVIADENGEATFGFLNRFYSVSTLPKKNNQSDAVDLARMFGYEPAKGWTKADWDGVFAAIAGQRTPVPVQCEYSGYYTHPLTNTRVYLRSADFFDGETYVNAAYLIDNEVVLKPTFPDEIAKDDYKAQKVYAQSQGWQIIYANFQPVFWAFKAKS